MKKKIIIKDNLLWLDNINLLPIVSGRIIFAYEVREAFLNNRFDCIAVGLPRSFAPVVLQGVNSLPFINAVIAEEAESNFSYFPIDPCDGIIEAIRLGLEEGVPIKFINRETHKISKTGLVLPDEYSIKKIGFSPYIQTIFPVFSATRNDQARFMASRLQDLSFEYKKILFVFSVHHLPAILHFYQTEYGNVPNGKKPLNIKLFSVHPDFLYFILGEIPYFTYLYEKLKGTITFEEFEKTEAIKKILLDARQEYHMKFKEEIYRISLKDVQTALQFVRNLCIIKNRFTPDLYELVVAAKGVGGNDYALKLIEEAKFYPYIDISLKYPSIKMTDKFVMLQKDSIFPAYRKVPALAKEWKRVKLEKKPDKKQKKRWKSYWNPNMVCSWPPEDEIIENFCGYVRKRALKLVGISQVRVEEFNSSLKDGIHLRETLRNWHLGKIYVKEEPQIHGEVGAVIFIFDKEDNDQKYPYKSTWHAEHQNESTLVFYATDFKENLIGPDIGRSFYGGALFIFPPQYIQDVWTDIRFCPASTNAEKLMMAGLYYSQELYIAVIAGNKPSLFVQEYAKTQQKRIVFIPLSSFSYKTLQKLRYFHILNGKHVRGWASQFIGGAGS